MGIYSGVDVTQSTSYIGLVSSEIKDYSYLSSWESFVTEVSQNCVKFLAQDSKTCEEKVTFIHLPIVSLFNYN